MIEIVAFTADPWLEPWGGCPLSWTVKRSSSSGMSSPSVGSIGARSPRSNAPELERRLINYNVRTEERAGQDEKQSAAQV